LLKFFTGIHQPSDARRVPRPFISVNRLRPRRAMLKLAPDAEWILDSGAFTMLALHGSYLDTPEDYAREIRRWAGSGRLLAAVSQDYMCEPFMLERTGLTLLDHQLLTLTRYDRLRACDTGGVYVLPVLQGYAPEDYAAHVWMYGDRLPPGAWVGVGSVCKRNGSPGVVAAVLSAIRRERHDLRLHGFGLKLTALASLAVREQLTSADSMAWSYAARREGRNANDWREACAYADRVNVLLSVTPDAGQ
jgi:hypothetical protein